MRHSGIPRAKAGEALRSVIHEVFVDDNFHYMDERERYLYGSYATAAEAIAVCQDLVDQWLSAHYKPGMAPSELYGLYTCFGADPFVRAPEAGVSSPFSAWDYARQRTEHVCNGLNS